MSDPTQAGAALTREAFVLSKAHTRLTEFVGGARGPCTQLPNDIKTLLAEWANAKVALPTGVVEGEVPVCPTCKVNALAIALQLSQTRHDLSATQRERDEALARVAGARRSLRNAREGFNMIATGSFAGASNYATGGLDVYIAKLQEIAAVEAKQMDRALLSPDSGKQETEGK